MYSTNHFFLWVSIHKTEMKKTLIMDLPAICLNENIYNRSVAVATYIPCWKVQALHRLTSLPHGTNQLMCDYQGTRIHSCLSFLIRFLAYSKAS